MRKIEGWPIFLFLFWCIFIGLLSLAFAIFIDLHFEGIPLKSLISIIGAVGIFYLMAIGSYKFWIKYFPFDVGEIPAGSLQEKYWMVYQLSWMFWFHPLLMLPIYPTPLSRLILKTFGAQIGPGSYSAGYIYDPIFVQIGQGSLVGGRAAIIPHVVEEDRLEHHAIIIGDGVTIGYNAIILAGVKIGHGASVSAMAVVTKGTQIGPGEVWGGIPAKRIR